MHGDGEGAALQGGVSLGFCAPGSGTGQAQWQNGDSGPTHGFCPAQGVSCG